MCELGVSGSGVGESGSVGRVSSRAGPRGRWGGCQKTILPKSSNRTAGPDQTETHTHTRARRQRRAGGDQSTRGPSAGPVHHHDNGTTRDNTLTQSYTLLLYSPEPRSVARLPTASGPTADAVPSRDGRSRGSKPFLYEMYHILTKRASPFTGVREACVRAVVLSAFCASGLPRSTG